MHCHFLQKEGDHYQDFILTKRRSIGELGCVLREVLHLPTGARILEIANDDPENLFCLSFRTLPSNSNGAPHILEHTVLCGSKKFPVRDPFFLMGRRSLNTFMNALTGSDFTCYPAASQVRKDFYNLLEVYLDAVFHPILSPSSFSQEGWRLEFAHPEDSSSLLQYKGVVFNEMKGAIASTDNRLWHEMLEALVPDLPYAFNSGGDPREIPLLSHEELLSFHKTFYHPSRCLFFFYGNLPLQDHLDFLAMHVLSSCKEAPPPLPSPCLQKRFLEPQQHTRFYPASEEHNPEESAIVAWGWLTTNIHEQEELLALCILDTILMGSDAGLLKKALLASGLCAEADAFMDTDMSEVPWLIVCKGCSPDKEAALETALITSLQQIVADGIPPDLVESALHQLEFSRLEITGGHSPFGLVLFMRSALLAQHGGNPEDGLQLHSLFLSLQEKVRTPSYLLEILQKHLLKNSHRVRLTLLPDPHLLATEQQEEASLLEKKKRELSEQDIEDLLQQARDLENYQKDSETLPPDCLPSISLSDVPLLTTDFFLQQTGSVFHHNCFTNHIVYADLVFDLGALSEEELPYVELLMTLLPELGCQQRSYLENLEYIQAHTGGLRAGCSLHPQASDSRKTRPAIALRSKALERKVEFLFPLLYNSARYPNFRDPQRIKDLLLQMRSSQQHALSRQGMRYALQLSMSGLCPSAHIAETWRGLHHFQWIEKLCADLTQQIPFLITKLEEMHQRLFSLHQPELVLSCSDTLFSCLEKEDFYGWNTLSPKHFSPWDTLPQPLSVPCQGRIIPSQVAACAESFKTVSYNHQFAPALTAASLLLEHKVLHPKIREKGGAYGSGASYHSASGIFSFSSYRDPHIFQTRATFHEAIALIADEKFSHQDLDEAKLGIIQQLDAPVSPGSRALTAYDRHRCGKTLLMRQQFRDQLLALTPHDVAHAVASELLSQKTEGTFVAFAGKKQLEQEQKLFEKAGTPFSIFSHLA